MVALFTEEARNVRLNDSLRQGEFERFAFEAENDLALGWLSDATSAIGTALRVKYRDQYVSESRPLDEVRSANRAAAEQMLSTLRTAEPSYCALKGGAAIHSGIAQEAGAQDDWERGKFEIAWSNAAGLAEAVEVSRMLMESGCPHSNYSVETREWIESQAAPVVGATPFAQEMGNLSQWKADWASENGLNDLRPFALMSAAAWRSGIRAVEGEIPIPTPDAVVALAEKAREGWPRGVHAAAFAAGTKRFDEWARVEGSPVASPSFLVQAYLYFAVATGDPAAHWPPPAP